jgi:hypothetical protein
MRGSMICTAMAPSMRLPAEPTHGARVLQMSPWMLVRRSSEYANHTAGAVSSPAGLSSRTYVQRRSVLVLPVPGASTGIPGARASESRPPAERATHLPHRPSPPAWSARSQPPGGRRSPTGDRTADGPRSIGRDGAGASTTRSHPLQANFGRT